MTDFARPRKALGQNFLQDPNIINKIVAAIAPNAEDMVVEIGPGRGALTDHLIAQAGKLHLIEFDRDLAAYWRQKAEQTSHLDVHETDVLKFDFAALAQEQKWKVIGNLPYNISSPVLFHLMQFAHTVMVQVFMLQKEVVDRLVAVPGNKQYGRLSVMMQYRYQMERLFVVPPGAFFPPPKVDSAIVRMQPHSSIEHAASSAEHFAKVVKQAFSQRRKTLRNTLKQLLTAEQISRCDIDPASRAETLAVDDYVKLSNAYSSSLGSTIP